MTTSEHMLVGKKKCKKRKRGGPEKQRDGSFLILISQKRKKKNYIEPYKPNKRRCIGSKWKCNPYASLSLRRGR